MIPHFLPYVVVFGFGVIVGVVAMLGALGAGSRSLDRYQLLEADFKRSRRLS